MQLKNFHLNGDTISISYNGYYIDLHNNYDFEKIVSDEVSKLVKLYFIKRNDEWVPQYAIPYFYFEFNNVTNVILKDSDATEYPEDDYTLDMLGFSSDDNYCDGVLYKTGESIAKALIFIFETGRIIKIVGESVVFHETKIEYTFP